MTFDQWIALTTLLIATVVAALRATNAVTRTEAVLSTRLDGLDRSVSEGRVELREALSSINEINRHHGEEIKVLREMADKWLEGNLHAKANGRGR